MSESFLKQFLPGQTVSVGTRVSVTASLLRVQSWAQSRRLPAASLTPAAARPQGRASVGWETVHHTLPPSPCFDHTGLIHIPRLGGFRPARVLVHGFSVSAFVLCCRVSQPEPAGPASAVLSGFGGLCDVLTSWLSKTSRAPCFFPSVFIYLPAGVSLGSYCPSMFFPFQGSFSAWCFQNFFSWPCLSQSLSSSPPSSSCWCPYLVASTCFIY